MEFSCVIIAVIHDQFRNIRLDDLGKIMDGKPILVDIKRLYERADAESKNFYYVTL